MSTSDELIIKIKNDGSVYIDDYMDGVKSHKSISPDSLLNCLNKSILRGGISSGLLPDECKSVVSYDNGDWYITMLHPEDKADISYVRTEYKNFPLPRLIFGFHITSQGRISKCKLGVVGNESNLKPTTPMFIYPFSNVSDTHLCIGNNTLPKVQNLYTLSSLTYHIMSMDNNNDHFKPSNNNLGLEMRDLLELLKDKQQSYYYNENILVPSGKTLGDFIV